MNEFTKAMIATFCLLYAYQIVVLFLLAYAEKVKTKKQFYKFLNPLSLYTFGFQKLVETIKKIKQLPRD